ncbi:MULTISPECIES: TIGR01440 family protein [unclassified Virgibacillus]|uniref:TIGR01440 family protein n=1 Tax=unclassified Virgibacillus TaxID=2620237 RepID=UPI0024DEF93F|nr:TIGR01440 family protein [Virgibacillus sp. LDC-1]
MKELLQQIETDMKTLITEWVDNDYLNGGDLFVVGCSTSEIAGKRIGTAGSEEIAAAIFKQLQQLQKQTGIELVFQCCEHLNRALVVEQETMKRSQLEAVSVIPHRKAGGAMATYAYKHLKHPVVVESIKADAGIDIGETMIGMQLKHVAVPLRFQTKTIGNARLNGAKTRPKLIGGERAVYQDSSLNQSCN